MARTVFSIYIISLQVAGLAVLKAPNGFF